MTLTPGSGVVVGLPADVRSTASEHPPGRAIRCDLWFPPSKVAVGCGQEAMLPVLVMVAAFSRFIAAVMLPSIKRFGRNMRRAARCLAPPAPPLKDAGPAQAGLRIASATAEDWVAQLKAAQNAGRLPGELTKLRRIGLAGRRRSRLHPSDQIGANPLFNWSPAATNSLTDPGLEPAL